MLNEMTGFEFVIKFKTLDFIINEDETKYSNFSSKTKAGTIIQSTYTDSEFKPTYSMIMTKTPKYQAEASSWTIDLVIE